MTFDAIIILLIAHWISDFVIQKEEWARGKHNSFTDLMSHTLHYALTMYIIVLIFHLIKYGNAIQFMHLLYFWFITLVTHTIVDFITSKFTYKYSHRMQWYFKNKSLGFFPMIGLDQTIHYIMLFYSYKFLFL